MSAQATRCVLPSSTLPASLSRSGRKRAIGLASPILVLPASRPPVKRRKGAKSKLSPRIPLPPPAIVSDQVGHRTPGTHKRCADLILHIRETYRRRQDFLRAEQSLTNQIWAIGERLQLALDMVSIRKYLATTRLKKADGQGCADTQVTSAVAPSTFNGGGDQHSGATLSEHVSIPPPITAGEGQGPSANHGSYADPGCSFKELRRRACLKSPPEKVDPNVLLFATLPLLEARAVIKKNRLSVERECVKLAKTLPVYPWVEAVHGFGALGLAQIVGEAGDLANYANPAKLWKRMGLAVVNGKSQRRVAGAGAIEQGYNPKRRSIMFVIGDSLLKKQNPYRELYLARKVLEQAKVPEGSKMLWHRRAHRYAEKRLLLNLWSAWRARREQGET